MADSGESLVLRAGGHRVDPDVVTRALVANRRAAQLLRLLEAGDGVALDELLVQVVTVAEWVFIDACLASIRRTSQTGDDAPAVAAALDGLLAACTGDHAQYRAWMLATAVYTLQRLAQKYPRSSDRARYYRLTAQRSYDGEEPGSTVRRTVFGQSAAGD